MPKTKGKKTTISVEKTTAKALDGLKHRGETYNDVVKKLLGASKGEVYIDLMLIDNELPQLHTCVFQLGEDADSLYFFDGKAMEQIPLDKVNKLMKAPKPNMAISREDAKILLSFLTEHLTVGLPPHIAPTPQQLPVYNRLHAFLESDTPGS